MELGHFNRTDSEVLADTILLWLKGSEAQLSSFGSEEALKEAVEHL